MSVSGVTAGFLSESELRGFLKSNGIKFSKLSLKKKEILTIGCQLLYLNKEDVLFISDNSTSDVLAESRLRSRRLGCSC